MKNKKKKKMKKKKKKKKKKRIKFHQMSKLIKLNITLLTWKRISHSNCLKRIISKLSCQTLLIKE